MARPRRLNWTQLVEEGQTALVGLDSSHRIRAVSPGMTALTGWQPDQLISLRCHQAAAPEQPMPGDNPLADMLAASLAPPDAGMQGVVIGRETVLPDSRGNSLRLHATFVPLMDTLSEAPTNYSGFKSAQLNSSLQQFPAAEFAAVLIVLSKPGPAFEHSAQRSVMQHLHAEINALRLEMRRRFGNESFIGQCNEVQRAVRQAEILKTCTLPFCVTGPQGSGRRHLVRLIHNGTPLAEQSLVFLDCHLLSTHVLLSTLHQLRSAGQMEPVSPYHKTGMLVLTEIQRLPTEVQRWLLDQNYFDTGKTENTDERGLPVRIAATSQTPLDQLCDQGLLLPELSSQLSNIEIKLPSLHDRGDDVLLLFRQFIDECRRDHKTKVQSITPELQTQVLSYRWPGQVRELRSLVEAACKACQNAEIGVSDMPYQFRVAQDAQRRAKPDEPSVIPLEQLLQQFEQEVISSALISCDGNKTEVARRLGLTRPKLYRRMKALGLEVDSDDDE